MTTRGSYKLLRISLLLAVLAVAGCSIDSQVNPPKGMRCVVAHDDSSGTPICDTYSPVPGVTP